MLEPCADRVAVLLPPIDGDDAALLALLADGEAWSTSALALALGSSQRTVQRALASLEAAGVTPKAFISARIVLEAKRLLVHSGESVAQVGHRLGFSEPTNFVKFFRRMAGSTPQAFRRQSGCGKPDDDRIVAAQQDVDHGDLGERHPEEGSREYLHSGSPVPPHRKARPMCTRL